MKKATSLATWILSTIVLLSSCAPALTVTNDYDKTANFSSFHTFKIVKLEQQHQALSQFNQTRIINAVRANMISKGFTETENADLLVNIVTILKNEQQVVANTTSYGYGYGGYYRPYGWGGGNSSTTVNVEKYVDGSLIIEVANASTQKLIWEGIGNKQIDQPSSNPDQAIKDAVTKIMASFPPGMTPAK
jgi:Domain of unknown function (DUF4136)